MMYIPWRDFIFINLDKFCHCLGVNKDLMSICFLYWQIFVFSGLESAYFMKVVDTKLSYLHYITCRENEKEKNYTKLGILIYRKPNVDIHVEDALTCSFVQK